MLFQWFILELFRKKTKNGKLNLSDFCLLEGGFLFIRSTWNLKIIEQLLRIRWPNGFYHKYGPGPSTIVKIWRSAFGRKSLGFWEFECDLIFLTQSGLSRTSTSSICKFLVPVLRLLLCIQEICSPTTKAVDDRTSVTILGTGTRTSKIQDGQDVDVLTSPGPNMTIFIASHRLLQFV